MSESNEKLIPIFFATDDNYAPFLFVAIQSLVTYASTNFDYAIHILCENLNEENRKGLMQYSKGNVQIIITEMSKHIDKYADKLHTRDYYSKTTYFRMFIPNMYPEYKKALYLDCDIVLNADVSELFNYDLEDYYVGGITCEAVDTVPVYTDYAEKFLGFKLPDYFNAGILLMNLDNLRKNDFQNRFFEILSKVNFTVIQDQDYLNVLCRGHVRFLPKVWNKIPLPVEGVDETNVKLVHYNLAFRPWRYDGILFGDLFWKHAKNTIVYDKLVEMKKNFSQKDAEYDISWGEKLQASATEHANREKTFKSQIKNKEIILDWYKF